DDVLLLFTRRGKDVQLVLAQLAKTNINTDTKQRSLDDMIKQKTKKYASTDPRQFKLTESIVKDLIIECGLPVSLIDQNGFKNFMQTVDPIYSLLSRRQLTYDKLPKLYDKMIMKLKLNTDLST
ncbi:unnamed protein product, partial [Adineta steineri]